MIVTVIGGSGFLGSHVADQLSEAGHTVRIFDIKESAWKRTDQEFIKGSVLDIELLDAAVKDSEVVYHFAALADLNEAFDKPIETVRINVLGTVNVLEVCRKNHIKRFIYASTVYVYSREGGFYRCSKQAAEYYVEEYYSKYNLNFTILRFGSLYGPRSDDSNGLFRIVREALQTGKIQLSRLKPEAVREFIHVEDAAKASVVALTDDFRNESVILTGSQSMRIIDFVKMLAEILGYDDNIEFINKEDTSHYVRTPYAYKPRLGRKYTPTLHVDLGQGLLQLIDEIKKIN